MGRHHHSRSLRSVSKEDVSSLLADSGISVSSPEAALQLPDEEDEVEALFREFLTDDEDADKIHKSRPYRACTKNIQKQQTSTAGSDDSTNNAIDNEADAADDEEHLPTVNKRARKNYICSVCRKQFGGNTDLKRHMLVHNDERPYKCDKCGKCYRQAVNLKNHITTMHEGRKNFQCPECPKAFALKQRLRLHMRLHSGEKPYACNTCNKRFARGGQLSQHLVMHHNEGAKIYQCQKCSSSFSTPANFRAHEARHVESPDLVCEVCQAHFCSDIMLRTHMKEQQHYKPQPFHCEICEQTIEDADLAMHMKTHKTHVCEVCNSCFTQKSQYNVHMRMHSGERPYECRICSQAFAHSSVLKLHIRKHTGEKPFHCQLCTTETSFSQLAHLKTHMKKIHKQDKSYMCEGCQKFFKIKVELLAHMEKCAQCQKQTNEADEAAAAAEEQQTLSNLRLLLAMLLKKISSKKKLQQLGYEKRLIDNVVISSLKLANRKAYENEQMPAIERLRLNVQEFLNWIVPANVMQSFNEQQLSTDDILDKVVSKHMQQN